MPSFLPLPDRPDWVALDTETSGLHPDDHARVACASITWPGPQGLETLAMPFDQGIRDKRLSQGKRPGQTDLFNDIIDPNLGEGHWLELCLWLKDQFLVMHNAKFDLTMMRAGTRHWRGLDLVRAFGWDTMLAQVKLDPKERSGLDETCRRLGLGVGKEGLDEVVGWLKAQRLPPKRYDLAPWDIIEKYVSTDTERTADLFLYQQQRLEEPEPDDEWDPDWLRDELEAEFELTRTLYAMEQRGLGYDHTASRQAAAKLLVAAAKIESKMPFPCTPKNAEAHFVKKLGLTVNKVSDKTGKPTLDEEQIRAWRHDSVEWAEEYYQVTRRRRAVSMWYEGYADKMGQDGRLRTSFRQGHVKSGRMSVERVQLQAMPKVDKDIDGVPGVRKLLVPKEGHGLWSLDLSQAELRVASKYAGCTEMLRQLKNGEDIHSNTTKQIIKVDGEYIDEAHELWKIKRDIAKRVTFGGIFQIGAKTFQATVAKLADIHMPIGECEELIRGWREMYPEFGTAWRKSMRWAETRGWVPLLSGTTHEQKSWFREYDYPNTAWNRVVQGSLAEGFKHLLNGVEQQWPGYLILTIHDSILLEMPLDVGDRVAGEVQAWAGPFMTDLYNIEMSMDIDRWDKHLVAA